MSEDFLSRWSRLKRESAAEQARRSEAQTADAESPTRDPVSAPPIDVRLPAVESLSAESSVAAFLQAGVPDDLTRAALRKAWTSDPAIRDFIGIAENQWDFNVEGTIAGFGSLSAEEYARHVTALALRAQVSTAPETTRVVGPHDSTDGPPTSASALPAQTLPTAPPPVGESQLRAATTACEAESGTPPQARRTHGSALPK